MAMIADTTERLSYDQLRKIVWNFADAIRDKGEGTTEDYAKVTIPTLALKRILDTKEGFLERAMVKHQQMMDSPLWTLGGVVKHLNEESNRFFDNAKIKINPTIFLLSWDAIMRYADNPEREDRSIDVGFGQTHKTNAANFVELMGDVVNFLDERLRWVFGVFNYEQLVLSSKPILPYADFYKLCHDSTDPNSLNHYKFDNEYVSGDIFGDVYMDLIGRFAHDSGKKGGEFFTPGPLTDGAIRLLNDIPRYVREFKEGTRNKLLVGDITSGSNTFLIRYDIEFHAECKRQGIAYPTRKILYYGQELKQFQGALGVLNMMFHGLIDVYNVGIPFEHQISNTITNYHNGIGKMRGQLDVVLANPPYGVKDYGYDYATQNKNTDSRFKAMVPNRSEGEHAFLLTIYDLLSPTGVAAVVMPLGTLFRDAGKDSRAFMLNDVEGIVTLPSNMFLTTQIPVCIWLLNKNKPENGQNKVFFVNAENDFKKVGKFNEWQSETTIKAYNNREEIEGYSGYVSNEVLEKNSVNFSVGRYFSKEVKREDIDLKKVTKDIQELNDKINDNKKWLDNLFAQVSGDEV